MIPSWNSFFFLNDWKKKYFFQFLNLKKILIISESQYSLCCKQKNFFLQKKINILQKFSHGLMFHSWNNFLKKIEKKISFKISQNSVISRPNETARSAKRSSMESRHFWIRTTRFCGDWTSIRQFWTAISLNEFKKCNKKRIFGFLEFSVMKLFSFFYFPRILFFKSSSSIN